MNMRKTMNLVEARRPAAPVVVNIAAQAQAVYLKANKTVKELQTATWTFKNGWDKTWVNELSGTLRAMRAKHDAAEKEEFDYQEGNYKVVPFNQLEALPEALNEWWDAKKEIGDTVAVDAKYQYDRYLKDHPSVEMSDELTVRQAEQNFGKMIKWKGGLGSLQSMDQILSGLSSLADDYGRSHDYTGDCRSIEDFVKKAMPLILSYCLWVGAKKA